MTVSPSTAARAAPTPPETALAPDSFDDMRGASEPAGATPGAAARVPVQRPFLARLGRALREELGSLDPRLLLIDLIVRLLPSLGFARLRTTLYRAAGARIGPRSLILGRIEFGGSGGHLDRLRIGADTVINVHFFADLNAGIEIGDGVSIGHHVTLITAEHEQGPARCRAGPLRPAPIAIGDGCWIGAGSTLLPGVSVGRSSIVAAGSLVSGRVPDNRLVGGVPARPLRVLPPEP